MAPAFAPVVAGATLLVLAGLGKVRRPASTLGALKSVGLPVRRPAVRVLGAAEVLVGVSNVVLGGRLPAALLGLAYLAFTVFVIVALRRGGAISSCGCLGRPDTPPTRTHALVTTLLGISGFVAAGTGGIRPFEIEWNATDATLVAFAAVVTWLAWVVFAVLPHARLPRLEGR